VAVDTSFGLSPQSGLPQNNRVGDMDAFAALFVMEKLGLDADAMARVLANESGLAGISGQSGDVRDLETAAAAGDGRARLALDVFVQAVRRYLGAFLVRLGGLDVLSFSGGIGENSAAVRAAVCDGLGELGIRLDPARNAAARGEAVLSPEGARVTILLVPADEERIVARAVAEVVGAAAGGAPSEE
jgi:acetate kinase